MCFLYFFTSGSDSNNCYHHVDLLYISFLMTGLKVGLVRGIPAH